MDLYKAIYNINNEIKAKHLIDAAIYIYMEIFKFGAKKLSATEREVYLDMVYNFVTKGRVGRISELPSIGKYTYQYIKHIKDKEWMEKDGDSFIFPPDIVAIAKAILTKEGVTFHVKVYEEERKD